MKTIFAALICLNFSVSAHAFDETKVCQELEAKAWDNCREAMCEDWVNDEGKKPTKENIQECLDNADGDLNEGAQICVVDGGELDSLIEQYNKKNPRQPVKCEE